ncbi:MAG: thrombospondin type 3 repeat-containing protein, partial [Kiritimatiellae bacterium]|nr:thrombospondin type 3 repeat-containing protein [Kiritimatiellia bacterium]
MSVNAEEVSNVVVGAALGGDAWGADAIPTNVTSLAFYPVSYDDTTNPDRDTDGVTTEDELFVYGTDPDLADTDCDGVSDGDEIASGTNPNLRDTDGDGLVDGSDPDPLVATPADDSDADGIPDAYETHWFGGTGAVNVADVRDETGFTLDGKILGGVNPTNGVDAAVAASDSRLVSWKLFGGFAADWSGNATNLVWERTFSVVRASAWQQLFVSASPTNAAPWRLEGATLEWETDTGASGSASASPCNDSFRIPLATNDMPRSLTLRVRSTDAGIVRTSTPMHLIAYAPTLRIEGGREITGESGRKFVVFLDGSRSSMRLVADHSRRPCRATPGRDECDGGAFGASPDGWPLAYDGNALGGFLRAGRPGEYALPPMALSATPPLRMRGNGGGDDATVVVLSPSAWWRCQLHGTCARRLGYDWSGDAYGEEDAYPLDTACLDDGWHRGMSDARLGYECELVATSGAGDGVGWASAGADGGRGRVFVDGVEVWSCAPEHVHVLGGGCDDPFESGCGCDAGDCADGNCDALEGPTLGSLKFRIPLGAPVKGQVAGFVWFATEEPITISKSTFRLLAHPEADVSDGEANGVRRIVCGNQRGRSLTVSNIANGACVRIDETDTGKWEHSWEIVNVDGDASKVMLRKISRLYNVMSDETYTYDNGVWTRLDNIAGIGTRLESGGGFGEGVKTERRTTTDAEGRVLASVTNETSRIGECDSALMRETYREESTGRGMKWSRAEYWDDPQHSGRHGKPRLVWGNARAWEWHDYDEFGHETLLVEQRGNAAVPYAFPSVVSNELRNVGALANAFVTARGYEPLQGDSRNSNDTYKARCETRYVVTNGVAAIVGRTWTRYKRLSRDGYPAVKEEKWRATSQGAEWGDESSAYSYEVTFADTGIGTPLLMRGAVAESLDEDGVLTVCSYSVVSNVLHCTTRRSFGGNALPTYETTERNADYGTVLRRTTRLTDGDTVIADEHSIYDNQNRLRSTTYLDGTSLTNSYSCCRLLWKRDREGRKTLRSAKTGTDHLYNAFEDVWLGDASTNGQYRVTQHFYDALGRETNTVVYAGATPKEAEVASSSDGKPCARVTTEYPFGGDDYAVRTDERGKVAVTRTDILGDCIETSETVSTNGVEVSKTKSRSYFGGGSSTRKEWDGHKWTEERRFEDYAADGRRIEYVVTSSYDCGTVTNAVTVYDFLGRVVSVAKPGANGSTIVTVNAFDGTTARILSVATTGSPTVVYGYNELGERTSSSQDGITILNDTFYETISQQVYRVATTVRMAGNVTNAVQVRKIQLTGLSDALRSRTITVAASGRETVAETSFDAATGLLTSVTRVGDVTPVTTASRYGVALSQTGIDGTQAMSYDAIGRNVAVASVDSAGVTNCIDFAEYDWSGNAVRRVTDFLDGRVAEATAEYDSLNQEVRRTDALDNETVTGYDSLGRTAFVGGDAYPIATGYDSAGRKTSSMTTRDGGANWDETQWAFDPASGVNLSKTYA